MIIPIEPEEARATAAEAEKGFALVDADPPRSASALFEKRAEEIARAAEGHVRQMMDEESRLVSSETSETAPPWTAEAERFETVPFGLKRRVVLRVPVFARRQDESQDELRRIRGLMAQVALDLIAQVIEINRYFAAAGLVKAPELRRVPCENGQARGSESAGKIMSGGSAGSSFRRRA
jgi:hypothetical protein